MTITATYPAGKVLTTVENVRNSVAGETEEADEAYPHFAEVAAKEGFNAISYVFKSIAVIEKQHATRFANILNLLENEHVFELQEGAEWICMKCGYIHKGAKAPHGCPVCAEINPFMPLNHDFYAVKK